jgi:Domain of unknown function (DUF397)
MNTSSSDSPWRKSSYSSGVQGECVEVGTWRKSSYSSGGQSQCVEVAAASAVLVRDTTNREGCTLSVPAPAWSAFLATIR